MSGTGHSVTGRAVVARPSRRLFRMVWRLEHEVLVGVERAADVLLSPLALDFRGWTFGDQRNETWM